ncbi:Ig-like domain-containing protein [Halarcobacter anaerophilus]|uniref:Ig-like domain-containing protein n=1 Tax=Halarcobacter anaerophilus TaxID=877500 RepID=UPI000696972F|nr:Ig-like domain-containing protein [Halarcobacter anaerophilus]
MAIARITDIKGLVTLDGTTEEILKNRDEISDHGGLLTIAEFAKIIFEDGREVEVTGPVSFNLDSTFFNEGTFEESITQISDLASLEYIDTQLDETKLADIAVDNITDQISASQNVDSEQLNTQLNQDTTQLDTQNIITPTILNEDTTIENQESTEDTVIENNTNDESTDNTPVDTEIGAPSISFENPGEDGIYNAEELGEDGTISATIFVTGSEVGDTLIYTVNGEQTTVVLSADDIANGITIEVTPESTVTATLSDTAGNSSETASATASSADVEAQAGTVSVDNITTDDVINASEADETITVTGTATGGDISEGDSVSFTVNGTEYSATVGEDGTWSADVAGSDLAADTSFEVSVESSDEAGNTVTTTGTSTHTVDVEAQAGTVSVDNITTDDVINASEADETITVTGTATGGDISEGDSVSFTVNGTEYSATVGEDGTWSADVAGSDLAADTSFEVSVESSDEAGNTVTTTGTSTHTVDVEAQAGTVSVDNITTDDVINASEADETITVTGTATGGDISEGDSVSFTVNGTEYSATVGEDGSWSADVAGSDLAADTSFEVSVESSDEAGNTVTTKGTSSHTVDVEAQAGTVSVDNITTDDVINASEADETITVTGTATGGDISEGDSVSFTVNGTEYRATVGEDGTWSADVAGSDLAADTSFEVSVESSDEAGNTVTTTGTSTHTVDVEAQAGTVSVDNITTDDVINASEADETITVTGTATGGDISEGDSVSFTVNGTEYSATVGEDGTWSADVAGSDLAADTSFEVSVESSDEAGNTVTTKGTSSHTVDVEAQAGTVSVDNITTDDVINASEADETITVTGTATGGDISEGDSVSFTVNGTEYSATVGEDGSWSADVAGSDLAADTSFEVSVESSDEAGNTVTTKGTSTHTVDVEAQAGTVSVDNITTDDVINASEADETITVTGTATGGDISEGDSVSFTVNGTEYSATVGEDGTWSADVAGSDLAADTSFEVSVESSDEAGNTVTTTGTSTHTVDVEAQAGTVSVDNITTDDVINASEADETITVTGTATGGDISEGDSVSFTVNGTEYSATVGEDGTWSADVAGSDLAADTSFEVSVESSDEAGNTVTTTGTSTHTVDVEAQAGTVSVDNITTDDVINASEADETITVTGTATGGDISEGDSVSFTVNGTEYSATVGEDGSWSADVAGSDLAADTSFEVSVESSDEAGNTVTTKGTSSHTVDVEAQAGTVSVDNITTDDVINASEADETITVTGTATGGDISEGDSVSFTVNGTEYSATVGEDGSWSADVAGSDLAADTSFEVSVESSDEAGNTVTTKGTSTHTVDVEAQAGTVSVDNITTDDVINASEADETITVTGTATGGDISEGDSVSFTVNGTEYSATVGEDGSWSADVAGSDLAADTSFEVSVESSDEAGNTVTTKGTSTHTVDVEAQAGTVSVDNITTDDVINASEADETITVTGTATGGDISEGDSVSFTVNGTEYSATVGEDGTWSADVAGSDLAADTSFEVSVESSDEAGNTVTTTGTSTHTVDVEAQAGTVSVDNITTDDVINASEADETITVTGTATGGDISEGDSVSFTVNGTEYSATVGEDGTWSADVAGSDLAADTSFEVSVESSDEAGNTVTTTGTSTHTVDVEAQAGTVSVDNITTDDVINASEADETITVTGTATGGDISEGDSVSFTVNGTEYSATVGEDGTWSADVAGSDLAADTSFEVSVESSDEAGNTVTTTGTSTHTVDVEAQAGTVSVDNITTDDVINASEADETITVTGTATGGDISEGDSVSFTVNGTEYSATVGEDGTWSADVAGSDLAADTSFEVSVESSDEAGNTVTTTGTSTHTVDVEAQAGTVSVDNITTDDVINASEADETITVTGTATGGDISEGDSVSFTVNGTEYSATVGEDGTWSADVAGSDLAADTSFEVSVESSDEAGNTVTTTGTSTHTVDVEAQAGTVSVDNITTDDVINASEADETITVTGTATGGDISEGDSVSFTVNGTEYSATVGEDGTWSADVAGSDLAADTSFEVSVESSDEAGNTVTTKGTSTHTVDVEAQAGTVSVDNITTDDVINASEADETITVTGTATGGDISEGDSVSFTVNGTEYSATVGEDGSWSADVAGSDLAADTSFEVSVESSDEAGNTVTTKGTSSHTVDVEAQAGTVSVDNITTDDVINASEADETITVTGTATGGDISEGDSVSFTVNGTEYSATVGEDGTWSADVAGSDLAADTSFEVSVESSDEAGNTVTTKGTSSHTVDVEAQAGTVSVDNITTDDVINASEADETITVTGTATGGDISEGDSVSFTVNGTEYSATVGEDGSWSADVAGSDLAADTSFEVSVESSDEAGNTVTTTGTSTHTVDVEAQAGTVSVDNITTDDVINASEADETITVTGTATGGDISEGDSVSFTVNGTEYSATVGEDGTWSADVAGSDLAADTSFEVSVESSDEAGNTVTTTGTSTHTVDVEAQAGTVSVDNITTDDVINASEADETITVTGTATGGDISEGDSVSFTVNGTEYSATVGEDGTWSADVAGSDLAADTSFEVSVESSDEAGNTVTTKGTSTHTVDVEAQAGTVSVDNITTDDVINASEADETITVTGTATGGDISEGDSVSFTVNGTEYSATVGEDGSWSADVAGSDLAADTSFEVSVESSDEAGNTVTTKGTSSHTVDVEAQAGTVSVDNITTDDVINASEADETITVTGTATGGDISEGDSVSFTVNGTEYSATVGEDGTWSADVAGSDLAADTSFEVSVESSDEAGNTVTTKGTSSHTVDVEAQAGTVSVDNITTDDVINASEADETITVTGTATGGDISEGDSVSFTVNGTEYSATVGEDGSWSADVAGSDLAADTSFEVSVESSDEAGNTVTTTGTSTHTVDVDTSDISKLAITDIVDNDGDYSNVTMFGTGAEAGNTISLYNENNEIVATTTVKDDGTWEVDISSLEGTPINDNEFFSVTETDLAGNETAQTDTTHYWHGNSSESNTESSDDFIMTGSGDDTINTDDILSGTNENGKVTSTNDDTNDSLVIDGGDGNDTVTFGGNIADYTVSTDEKGNVIVTETSSSDSDSNGIGDVTELRNIETIEFEDGTYDVGSGTFIVENVAPDVGNIDLGSINEDISFTFTKEQLLENSDDFNGDDLNIVSISVNPEYGTIIDNKDGTYTFNPKENYSADDVKINFTVSDGELTNSAIATVDITAVADAPTIEMEITKDTTIDDTNALDTSKGYTITAIGADGKESTISTVSNTDHDGFGVNGRASGDDSEIGYNDYYRSSEKIQVDLDNDASNIDVSFAWQNSGETVKIEFYKDGQKIDTQTIKGGSDGVDDIYTLSTSDDATFDSVVFSAAGSGDDFLIHEINVNQFSTDENSGEISGEIYDIDISASLADTDGSESLEITLTGIPDGVTLNQGTNNGDGTWTINVEGNSFDGTLKMSVPSGMNEEFNIEATATATDSNGDQNSSSVSQSVTVDTTVFEENTGDLTFVSEDASYANVIGYYEIDSDGNPISPATVIIDDQNGLSSGTLLGELEEGTDYGFFIISNGASQVNSNSVISFDLSTNTPTLLIDGKNTNNNVFHDNPEFNSDGKDHFIFETDPNGGMIIKVEDANALGDSDYDDVIIHSDVILEDKVINDTVLSDISGTLSESIIDGNDDISESISPNMTNAKDIGDGSNYWDTIVGTYHDDTLNIGSNYDNIQLFGGDDNAIIGNADKNYAYLNTGSGNDTIIAGNDWNNVQLGSGDDSAIIGNAGSSYSELNAGRGNDTIVAGNGWSKVDLGNGNNSAIVGDAAKGWSTINSGIGKDTIVAGDGFSNVYLGAGNDTLNIGDSTSNWTTINAGAGNDVLTIGDKWTVVDGEIGEDTVVFKGDESNYTIAERWGQTIVTNNTTGESTELHNVEHLQFGGTNPQNGDSATYIYDVNIDISNIDTNGETLSQIKIIAENLPEGATLIQNGEEINISNENEYILDANNLSNIKIVSPNQLEDDGKEGLFISIEATSVEANSGNEILHSSVLIDGVVEGAYYETSSGVTGLTDENGNFNFRAGDDVTFSVGGVVLGVATAEDIASGQTFLQDIADVSRSDLNDEHLENMAVFLQSIDTLDSGDNIVITQAMRDALSDTTLDLRTASEEEVHHLIESVGGNYVEESDAMNHVQQMLEEYTDMDSTQFEEHIDDNLNNATLGKEPQAGVEYQTSSGINGVTDDTGSFDYYDGDSITFSQNGEVLSTIDSQNIGDDNLLTLNELHAYDQNEIDLDNLELDFDNLSDAIVTDDIIDNSDDFNHVNISDMLSSDEEDTNSLSQLLGETEDDKASALSSNDEVASTPDDTQDTNLVDDYDPFKALEESSHNLMADKDMNDGLDDTHHDS